MLSLPLTGLDVPEHKNGEEAGTDLEPDGQVALVVARPNGQGCIGVQAGGVQGAAVSRGVMCWLRNILLGSRAGGCRGASADPAQTSQQTARRASLGTQPPTCVHHDGEQRVHGANVVQPAGRGRWARGA